MLQTLYRKYRPTKFSEIGGQKHIVRVLENAITYKRIGHAYLFTGPRGTGKTSLARIFAKTLNCEKRDSTEACQKCTSCLHIQKGNSLTLIEIDAASHTGVENIRELREEVKLAPVEGHYKIYIIDEVHMLSQGAFNALLKTLEEPPAHAIFILATTEFHKVPETIISRCQTFEFTRIPLSEIIENLEYIAKKEKITLPKKSLEQIALLANGGMRDAQSLLTQVFSLGQEQFSEEEIEDILGITHKKPIYALITAFSEKSMEGSFHVLEKLTSSGVNIEQFTKSLIYTLRKILFISLQVLDDKKLNEEYTKEDVQFLKEKSALFSPGEIIHIIDTLLLAGNRIKTSFLPELPLEIAFVRILNEEKPSPEKNNTSSPHSTQNRSSSRENAEKKISKTISSKTKSPSVTISKTQTSPEESIEKKPLHTKSAQEKTPYSLKEIQLLWPEFIEKTKKINNSLAAFLSHTTPAEIEENTLIIATKHTLYADKLGEAENRLTLEELLATIGGKSMRLSFVVQNIEDPLLSDAEEVFG